MMATWTLQKGIPLVVVEQEGPLLRLRQERFLSGVFKEDPEWWALQERWLFFFYWSNLPHFSLLVMALTLFQLLWQLWDAISTQESKVYSSLENRFRGLQVAHYVFAAAFLVILQLPLEIHF